MRLLAVLELQTAKLLLIYKRFGVSNALSSHIRRLNHAATDATALNEAFLLVIDFLLLESVVVLQILVHLL